MIARRNAPILIAIVLTLIQLLVASRPAGAACDEWDARFAGVGGPNGGVSAIAVDGASMYVAGTFDSVNGIAANGIAVWDGSTWAGLGTPPFGSVNSVAADAGIVYAATLNEVWQWGGSSWSKIGSTDSQIFRIVLDSTGTLYAGGMFTEIDGVSANRVAKWNGTSWSALGSGLSVDPNPNPITPVAVYGLAVDSADALYVGGWFADAGGESARNVAVWNGSAWSALGAGVDVAVAVLAFDGNGNLYAGGVFSALAWNGSSWTSTTTVTCGDTLCPGGLVPVVTALAFDAEGALYIGGRFDEVATVPATNLAVRRAGSAWRPVAGSTDGQVGALSFGTGTQLHVGGFFTTAGTQASSNFAIYESCADAGAPDPDFGVNGIVVTDVSGDWDEAAEILVQPDGKIVVAGDAPSGSFALVRYNADGSLDASFGVGGKAVAPVGSQGRLGGLAMQADDKLVASGWAETLAGSEVALVRFNGDGTLDSTFGGDGVVTDPIGDVATAVAVQADGKLIVAARVLGHAPGPAFRLARYNSNGTRDVSFGSSGLVTTPLNITAEPTALLIQPDGKLIAGGRTYDGTRNRFVVVRYLADGNLDTGFDGDGIAIASPGSSSEPFGLALQSDGKVVQVGYAWFPYEFAVVRYNPDGSLDTSFSDDGIVTTGMGPDAIAMSVALQSDGKMVVAGRAQGASGYGLAVARYTTAGALSESFHADGRALADLPGGQGARAVAVQSDGKLLVVGGANGDFVLMRLLQVPGCGDETLHSGEQCDDGDRFDGDCCSAACLFEVPNSSCTEDGHACTADRCNGVGTCVHSAALASGTVCRASAGECDAAEVCDGVSLGCPADVRAPIGFPCSEDGDPCTPDVCNGGSECEHLDSDSDLVGDLCDNCLSVPNLDQLNSDCADPDFYSSGCIGTPPATRAGCCDGGDVCDSCPARNDNTQCNIDGSASGTVGPSGGSIATPNGAVMVNLPAGALAADTSITITDNGPATLSAGSAAVLSLSMRPEGLMLSQPAVFTFTWLDRDGDDLVDLGECESGPGVGLSCDADADCPSGTCSAVAALQETSLTLKRNGSLFSQAGFGTPPYRCSDHLSGGCSTAIADCADAPGTDQATVAGCCDPLANTWTFQTCSFSEFQLGLPVADLVPGKGSKATDCLAQWSVNNPLNVPYADRNGLPNFKQTCTDGDPTCDFDGEVNGICEFSIGVCFGYDDPRLGIGACAPTAVDSWILKKPKVITANPLEEANALALRDAISSAGPSAIAADPRQVAFSPALPLETCSPHARVTLPLRGPRKEGRTTLRMQTVAGVKRDADKLKLICRPAGE